MKTITATLLLAAGVLLALPPGAARAADIDEFKVKREGPFEFASKPQVRRRGDRITVSFETKAFCDVTVAVENAQGKIVRHLLSGVLGGNAPEGFQKNSRKQVVIWDGKNDAGRYIDNKKGLVVRVSLGLEPRFERNLYWSPHKRVSSMPILSAAPEGVYLYAGRGVDHIRLFDHDGNYLRTVYPFPANKLKAVSGLRWHDFPQGYRRPLKESLYQQTLLSSGSNDNNNDKLGMTGMAASGMAVRGKRIAIAYEHLNRLATDGSSGGLPLKGPKTGQVIKRGGYGGYSKGQQAIGPSSLVFSPDGGTLYMTGYLWKQRYGGPPGCVHAVLKMNFAKQDAPVVFVGSRKGTEYGKGADRLAVPLSVECDRAGRVYVADYLNGRVQIFSPAGKLLKTLAVPHAAKVAVHQKTGDIYVFSWAAIGIPYDASRAYKYDPKRVKNKLTRFTPYPQARRLSSESFPLGAGDTGMIFAMGQVYQVALDSWSDAKSPSIWVVGRKHMISRADIRANAWAAKKRDADHLWKQGVRILKKKGGEWKAVDSFGERTAKAVVRVRPTKWNIQQLYVNPRTGKLYVGEPDSGPTGKAFKQLVEINPGTGRIKIVDLPFNPMDVAFDPDGLVYLRTTAVVARYNFGTWREVPWDYGERLDQVTCGMYGKTAAVISGLRMPSTSPVCFHQGGMGVSARGLLAVACHNRTKGKTYHADFGKQITHSRPYRPPLYPGREISSTSCSVHVWDKHGKVVTKEAIKGLPQLDGVFVDARGDLYVMATPTRIHDGKNYFNDMSSTLIKFKRERGKFISSGRCPIPVPEAARPREQPSVYRGGVKWVQGAEWFYGGVGFGGFNSSRAGGGCACWHARFKLDYFARSFAPEPYQYSVAVLDTNGNLITHVGKYGNVDDGLPLVRKGGPPKPRSIGGDEVGLFHADFVGVHTDRHLFIADHGNARILSVKLDYHATEKIHLRDVPDESR